MIERELLLDYVSRFFGYGTLTAKYWFVGLEEGGDDDLGLLEKRLTVWNDNGRPAVIDLQTMMRKLGDDDWFGPQARLQRTWRALIRTRFAAEGEQPSLADIKSYQRESLARADGDTALLELLPLPARSRRSGEPWPYAGLGIPSLATREDYRSAFEKVRRRRLVGLIEAKHPRVVITYGDVQAWRDCLGAHDPLNSKAWTGQCGTTTIMCTHHPEGARANAHWSFLGQALKERSAVT